MNIKVGIVSDLHAEFWTSPNLASIGEHVSRELADADLVLLAGDIHKGAHAIETAKQLFPDKPVCMVAGNHEFYAGDYETVRAALRGQHGNVHCLDRDTFVMSIMGQHVRVCGATLWTDFASQGDVTVNRLTAKRSMNDYRAIRHGSRTLMPEDTLRFHELEKTWLLQELGKSFDGTTIVLTHHAPVGFATDERYVNDPLTPCFVSRLEHHLVRDDIDLVVWGHTHHCVDRVLGSTRFVSCQTGYPVGTSKNSVSVETGRYGTVVEIPNR